jgi:predicted dehydrogenase
MSNKINIVIVGAGNIANSHLEVLSSIKLINLFGICSRTHAKANNLKKKYDIKHASSDYYAFIKNNINNIDGIMVLVSLDQMYLVSKKLIPLGKPIFIEKPPALSHLKIKALSEISIKYKTPNMIGMNRRFYSIFEKGKKIIEKNGGLLSLIIEGHERYDQIKKIIKPNILSRWLFANSCHTIDLIRYFGGEIKDFKYTKNSKLLKNGDHFSCSLKFLNGSTGTYISNWLSPGGWSVRLYARNTKVEFNPLELGSYTNSKYKKIKINPDKNDLKFKAGFYNQIKAFIYLINFKKNIYPSQSLGDIMKTFAIINKINN